MLACGITSAGAALGLPDASPRTVFVALLLGIVFGALWLLDRGAWRPWAAHTAARWTASTLLTGGLVNGRLADDAWAGGAVFGGTAAAVALAPAAVLALVWTVQRQKAPPSTGVG